MGNLAPHGWFGAGSQCRTMGCWRRSGSSCRAAAWVAFPCKMCKMARGSVPHFPGFGDFCGFGLPSSPNPAPMCLVCEDFVVWILSPWERNKAIKPDLRHGFSDLILRPVSTRDLKDWSRHGWHFGRRRRQWLELQDMAATMRCLASLAAGCFACRDEQRLHFRCQYSVIVRFFQELGVVAPGAYVFEYLGIDWRFGLLNLDNYLLTYIPCT